MNATIAKYFHKTSNVHQCTPVHFCLFHPLLSIIIYTGMIMRSPNLSILQSFRWIHAAFDFVNFDYAKVYDKFGDMNFGKCHKF